MIPSFQRQSDFSGEIKAFNAGVVNQMVWTGRELPISGAVELHFAFSGANDLDDIDRVRVRAGGDLIVELTMTELRTMQQHWYPKYLPNATTDQVFTVPLHFPSYLAPTIDLMDAMQFPPGMDPQVELVTLNTIAAGSVLLGWTTTNQPAQYTPRMLTQNLNIAANQNRATYNFSDPGIVIGWIMPLAGINRAELVISSVTAFELPGPQYGGLTIGSLYAEADFPTSGVTVTSARMKQIMLGIPAASGSSKLVIDTGAGWAGATNNAVIISAVPVPASTATAPGG